MRVFGRFLFSLYLWTVVASITTLVSCLILLSFPFALFDPHRRMAHQLGTLWAVSVMELNPFWRLKVVGRKRLRNHQGYVLVANHMSLADIICLFTLNHQFKWLAKRSLFQVPFLGWSMRVMRYIPLERGQHGSIKKSYREALGWLERDVSVLIFPEGTRSRSGEMSKFKTGAFRLALESQKPLIPIVLAGTRQVIPKGRAAFGKPGVAYLSILPPIETTGMTLEDEELLRNRTEDLMRAELQKRNRMITRVSSVPNARSFPPQADVC